MVVRESSKLVLREIVERLVSTYAPERIYLFGSSARGETQGDSDLDLMIIVPDDASAARRRSRLAYEVLRGTGVAVNVLVWTKQSFDERLHLSVFKGRCSLFALSTIEHLGYGRGRDTQLTSAFGKGQPYFLCKNPC